MFRSAFLALMAALAAVDPNLVLNPGFEDLEHGLPTGWQVEGARIDQQTFRSGRSSLRVGGTSFESPRQEIHDIPKGRKIVATAWVKTTDAPEVAMELIAFQQEQRRNTATSERLSGTRDWTKITATMTVPDDSARFSISFHCAGGERERSVWIDDVSVSLAEATRVETPDIVVALSTNRGHGWSGLTPLYGPYVIEPLAKKFGDKIAILSDKATPENIRRLVSQPGVKTFAWIGGGLADRIECNDTEDPDCKRWRPGFEPGAPELKDKVLFINSEFSTEYMKTLPARASLGYWTEMSMQMRKASYECAYFESERQPLDWYAPYFILMRRVIEDLAEGRSAKDAAERADRLWAGFLKWVEERKDEVPHSEDYLGIGKQMFSKLSSSVRAAQEETRRIFTRRVIKGPGIAVAEGGYEFTWQQDDRPQTIVFPIPQMYEEQAPIHLEFITRPENAIARVTLQERTDASPNWIAHVEFKPMKKGEKLFFNWKGHVLLGAKDYSKLPKTAAIPTEIPEDVRPWLKATKSVQVDDEGIRKKAKEIRDENLIQTIKNAIEFSTHMARNPKRGQGRPRDTSAVTALHWGDACTGSAHLAAALLRANGIPARVLANYPVWNQLFATHYWVEAWIPGFGWTRAESIMNIFPVPTYRDVVLSIVYPEDEDRSFDSPRWAALAVPHLSLTAPASKIAVRMSFPWGGDHVAAPVAELSGSAEEYRAAIELTREVWTLYRNAHVKGSVPTPALERQKKACEAKNLSEYMDAICSARDALK